MNGEKGFSLIEILFAIVLTGILGLAIPAALATTSKSTIVSNAHTMAESLARSQMDHVQNQLYDKDNNPPVYAILSDLPASYAITQTITRLDPREDGTANDDGLQQITVTVTHNTNVSYTLVDFKVDMR